VWSQGVVATFGDDETVHELDKRRELLAVHRKHRRTRLPFGMRGHNRVVHGQVVTAPSIG
jgi:hypothetical protein